MLRKRLVTILTFNEGVLFRTKLFKARLSIYGQFR